jgi:hypothetical protein
MSLRFFWFSNKSTFIMTKLFVISIGILFFIHKYNDHSIKCKYLPVKMSVFDGVDLKSKIDSDSSILNYNLKKYYHHVNLATRAIYKNDFFIASTQFDTAFLYKKIPFFPHIKNFILVNNKCGFYSKNEKYIRLLFTKTHIDTSVLFQNIPNRVFNDQNLMLINKLQGQIDSKKDLESAYEKALREIFISDQKAHEFNNNFNPKEIKEFYRVRDSIDTVNSIKFLSLYETEGFPTEEKVGVFYDKHQEWSFVTQILLWHFIHSESSGQAQILVLMEKELKKGNLHPSNYACLLDIVNLNSKKWKKEYNFMNTTVFLVSGSEYRPFVYYSDSLMREVNTNRISIGLDSFHITQKQVVCTTSCGEIPDHSFISMSYYAKIEILSEGFVKYALEKENQNISQYRINTEKIINECKCQEKYY